MKIFILLLFLVSCDSSILETKKIGPIETHPFFEVTEAPALNGADACENSMLLVNGEIVDLFDEGADGRLVYNSETILPAGEARFSYITETETGYQMVYTKNNNIYTRESADLKNWYGEKLALERNETNRFYQWNAAMNGDILAVECSDNTPDQKAVRIDFIPSTIPSLPMAGNPWMENVPGKGLLLAYGQIVGGFWETKISALIDNVWTPGVVLAREQGIHICDPHLIQDKNGFMVLTVSYDQRATVRLKSIEPMSLNDLWNLAAP